MKRKCGQDEKATASGSKNRKNIKRGGGGREKMKKYRTWMERGRDVRVTDFCLNVKKEEYRV